MRIFTILIILFICAPIMAQTSTQDEKQAVSELKLEMQVHNNNAGQADIAQNDEEEAVSEEEEKEAENKKLLGLAEKRAVLLQQELNLSNYASDRIKKAIIKYSIQANKVIQSNASANEKTKNLSNIVYFQNEAFKKVLTVHQFYKYINLTSI